MVTERGNDKLLLIVFGAAIIAATYFIITGPQLVSSTFSIPVTPDFVEGANDEPRERTGSHLPRALLNAILETPMKELVDAGHHRMVDRLRSVE